MSQTITPINDDIFQVALPLPFALNIINAYLIRGDDGWTIVDTGLNSGRCRQTWLDAFEALGIEGDGVEQIVLTHSHPDHYGLAGWLQERFSQNGRFPAVKLSAKEAAIAQMVWHDMDGWRETTASFWARCGLERSVATAVADSATETGKRTRPHPTRIELLDPNTELKLGNRLYQLLEMPGHSDGQLIFYDPQEKLLFSGDHVLNKITPNISLWPYSIADPLGAYLDSFETLRRLDVRLALPGHKTLITHLNDRLTEIERHHEARLALILTAVSKPKTVQQISNILFNHDKLSIHETRFAITETLAHLEYLQIRGKLKRLDAEVWKYQ